MRKIFILIILFICLAADSLMYTETKSNSVIILTGGRIFDGNGGEIRSGSILIEKNIIKKILPLGRNKWPKDARVIDISGKTVMPGLIELHAHITGGSTPGPIPSKLQPKGMELDESYDIVLQTETDRALSAIERLRWYLESGITTVRDVASFGTIVFRLKEWIGKGRYPGPRIFACGQMITASGGHGGEEVEADAYNYRNPNSYNVLCSVDGATEWRKAVRDQYKKGADFIKISDYFSREEVAAAVDEAHRLGLKVTGCVRSFYIQWAVEAGVDVISHAYPRPDETIRLMAEKGIASDPTLLLGVFYPDRVDSNLKTVRKMKQAGVKIGVGTDMWYGVYRKLPIPYITELKYLVRAGFSIPESLQAATKVNAEILGIEDRLGTIVPGKLADIIVIDGKPDENLDDLAKVELVIKDGVFVAGKYE